MADRFDYEDLVNTVANPLIDEFGDDATLTKASPNTGPDSNPTPGTPVSSPIVMVETNWRKMYRDESLVKKDDKFWQMNTAGAEPEIGDRISYQNLNYVIVNVEPFKPGPTIMYHDVHGRR